jgi:hypothetical protein
MAGFQNSGAAGITQMTGDVLAGPGSGTQTATLQNDANTQAVVAATPLVAIYNNNTQN